MKDFKRAAMNQKSAGKFKLSKQSENPLSTISSSHLNLFVPYFEFAHTEIEFFMLPTLQN